MLRSPPPRARGLALIGGLLALSALGPAPAWSAAEPITPCTAEPTNMTLTPGDLVDCDIGVPGDTDVFTFAGTADSKVVLSLAELSRVCWNDNKRCPRAVVLKPDGTLLVTLEDIFSNLDFGHF